MMFFVLGTLALLIFLSFATWQSALVLRQIAPTTNLLLLPGENILRLGMILVCVILARASGLSPEQFGWSANQAGQDMLLGVAIGVVVAFILPAVTNWAVARFGKQVYSPIVVLSILPRNRREWFWVPLALVPAVLLEEVLFRSLLLGGFASFAPPIFLAVVWSILFGALHVPQGALGTGVAAALGLMLSILFLATASIIAPLVAHYLINLLQLIWVARDKSLLEWDSGSSGSS